MCLFVEWNNIQLRQPHWKNVFLEVEDKVVVEQHDNEVTLSEMLFTRYEENKCNEAIRINNECITYEELYLTALRTSFFLKEGNFNGKTLAVVGHRNFSTYVGILAALFAGYSYTPINPKAPKSKITEILSASEVDCFIGDSGSIAQLQFQLGKQSLAHKTIISPLCNGKDKISQRLIDSSDIESVEHPPAPLLCDDTRLAYILYTSGSTGKPKGVQITRKNLCSYLKALNQLWDVPKGFRMSQFHDLSFDPSVSDIFYTFCNKGILCVVPENEMLAPSNFIIREKLNIWSSVPSIGLLMSKMGELSSGKYPTLNIVRHAGEPFPLKLAKLWQSAAPNASIENHYGPTEATIDVARHIYVPDNDNSIFNNEILPIGKSFPNMKITLVNEGLDEIVEKNKQGEIVFSGPQVSNGYINDKSKTEEHFVNFSWDKIKNIWYRSGDLGYINNHGDIECVGRQDSQIKIAGRRVEIGEIEAALSQFQLTNGAVVVPLRNEAESIIGCAAFVLGELSNADIKRIREQSATSLDPVFFPKRIVTVDQFPRSQSGKIDRKALEKIAKAD